MNDDNTKFFIRTVSRFHATFRVIYRNFDYLRDSVGLGGQTLYTIVSHNQSCLVYIQLLMFYFELIN